MKRRFNTLADCRRYLADVLNRLEEGKVEADGVRVRSYATGILSKIIENSDLEDRVKALEAKLEGGK
ncbi:MAG: hypothetical protein HY881_16035 [Deltaproteobacteria bacterium]|nr:hypothetical protein [Deltaproteobacteria bacterium]